MKGSKFHKKVRRDILSTGMNLAQLSRACGFPRHRCSVYWRGDHYPKFEYIIVLCQYIHGDNWQQHLIEYAQLLLEEQ